MRPRKNVQSRRYGGRVFEKFTERARQVVVLAQDEARALKHSYIGTEHILLGLLREEEGLAARVLESLQVTLEPVRAQVARIVGQGEEVATGQIPFTPRAKKVLELALKEALALGHDYIGSEHILLGLVRESSGVGARILADFNADADTIRDEVIRTLSTSARPTSRARVGGFAPAFALADLAVTVEDAKRALIATQEFEQAAQLRDQQRRLHEVIREIEANLARLARDLQLPSRASDAARREYEVKTLEGGSHTWAEQLATWRRDGWELLSILQDGEARRAILERRV